MDEKHISFLGLIFLALEWNSAEPSVSQKGPGKIKAVILRASSLEFLALSVKMSSNRHGKT